MPLPAPSGPAAVNGNSQAVGNGVTVLAAQPNLAATGQVGSQAYTGPLRRITSACSFSLCLLLVTDLVTSALQIGTGNTNLNPQLNNALVAQTDSEGRGS